MFSIKVHKTDVLIIGSGGAGVRAAIELHRNKKDVIVVGKCAKRDAHTIMATGGINAALGNMDSDDSWQLHAADTIRDGGLINDGKLVEKLCRNSPDTIKELSRWGCKFNREKNRKISQRFFGAATYRRACFVGDQTGKAILNTVIDEATRRKIKFKPNVYISSLLMNDGKVNGAVGLDVKSGEPVAFHAKAVILATGGHSRMFKRSSSRFWENNGDGIKLGMDVGCKFMDMEMFQFHPTGMVPSGVLVTEAVRAEGGLLLNKDGERFMERYDPERMELSARDVVARAIWQEIEEGRGTESGGVYLDISHISESHIRKRLPKIMKQFKDMGIDITKEKMEVAPTAHYSMGGIQVDVHGRTGVPNLYAIGEVTSGVHGGNRLGGNSLAEIMVFGRFVGEYVAKHLPKKWMEIDELDRNSKHKELMAKLDNDGYDPIETKREIQRIMWKYVGIVRDERNLNKALDEINSFKNKRMKTDIDTRMNEKLIAALDVRSMIPTCEMIILSALKRKESRAAHYRRDYPKTLEKWKRNIVTTRTKNGFKLSMRDVVKPSKSVEKYLDNEREHHLLE